MADHPEDFTILQIIPAPPGLVSRTVWGRFSKDGPKTYIHDALLCLALVEWREPEGEPSRSVVGIYGDTFADFPPMWVEPEDIVPDPEDCYHEDDCVFHGRRP
jgi:hypothetical protein